MTASGRDVEKGQRQRQQQLQRRELAGEGIHSHLRDDGTVAKMGHPFVCGWLGDGKDKQQQRQQQIPFGGDKERQRQQQIPFGDDTQKNGYGKGWLGLFGAEGFYGVD
jgi:hypothetical protein